MTSTMIESLWAAGAGCGRPASGSPMPEAGSRPMTASVRLIRQQRQHPRAHDGRAQPSLVLRARAGDPPRQDLRALGHEGGQQLHVLVVDLLDLVRTELAHLA